MSRAWVALGALAGGVGVLLGAFGAHALDGRLGPEALHAWQTAVQYQFVHGLALCVVGISARVARSGGSVPGRALGVAGAAFALGLVLFCGSLYALALGGPRWLGPVTPLGGIAFLVGWFALVVAALRSTRA